MGKNALEKMGWHPGVFTQNRRDGHTCTSWPIHRQGSSVRGYGDSRDEAISDAANRAMLEEEYHRSGRVYLDVGNAMMGR